MATKTVSAAGGNFGAGAAWVGGVAPVANDDIVANATSGNLTINAATVNLVGANFTGYTRTLAFGTNLINLTSGSTLTLSSTMTITSTNNSGRFQWATSGTGSIVMTGGGICRIPYIQATSGTLNISGSGQVYFGGFTGLGLTTTGNDFTYYGSTHPGNPITVTSPQFCFIRPDTTLTLGAQNMPFSRMVFDTTASVTTTGSILSTFTTDTYIRFDKSPAFSAGVPISYLTSVGSLTHTLDVATSSVKITRLNIAFNSSSNLTTTIYLPTNTNIGKMMITPYFQLVNNFTFTTQMLSNSKISIDELVLMSGYGSFTSANGEPAASVVITGSRNNTLRLSSGATWSIASPNSSGVSPIGATAPSTIISSWTASVPAKVIIGNTFSFDNTQIIDIDNVGSTPVYAFTFSNNTLTRVTGITSSFPSSGGGGAGGSFTFVS